MKAKTMAIETGAVAGVFGAKYGLVSKLAVMFAAFRSMPLTEYDRLIMKLHKGNR